jgi:hypothetical protein
MRLSLEAISTNSNEEAEMRKRVYVSVLMLAFVVGGCATTPTYNPFQIPQSDFHLKIKTIAMSPLVIPKWIGSPEAVKSKMEDRIRAQLEEAGFKIIPPEKFQEIWDRLLDQMGGVFDPLTGEIDKEKLETIRSYARREVSLKYGVDAFLHPSIELVGAKVDGFSAIWDGTTDSIIFKEWYGAYHGVTNALSLAIIIVDTNGVNLYINRGGIQVASKIYNGRFIEVPPSELLANEERNMEAVYIAFKALVEKPLPTK